MLRVAIVGAVALLAFSSWVPAASATAQSPQAHEVIQAAFYSFAQAGPTNQSIDRKCVLVEQFAGLAGADNASARNATDSLLASTNRSSLVLIDYHDDTATPRDPLGPPNGFTKFDSYYDGQIVPTVIFDGTRREFGGGAFVEEHYRADFSAAANVSAGASLNATGGIVLANGWLEAVVFSPFNLSAHRVGLSAVLVEDRVLSPVDARELHYVQRKTLGEMTYSMRGNATLQARWEFTVDLSWVESRLGAVLLLQVDALPVPPVDQSPAPRDFFLTVVLPAAVLATGATLVLLLVRFTAAERRLQKR